MVGADGHGEGWAIAAVCSRVGPEGDGERALLVTGGLVQCVELGVERGAVFRLVLPVRSPIR